MQAKSPKMLKPCPACKGREFHYDNEGDRYMCLTCKKVVSGSAA
jgi:hypothetical protein